MFVLVPEPKSVAEPNVVEIIVYQQGFTDVHLLFNPVSVCINHHQILLSI